MQFEPETFTHIFKNGEVFAYPTEAVYGLGCDPLNEVGVYEILALKSRPVEKGMILIAQDISQIWDFVRFNDVSESTRRAINESWPGPVTWLLPKSSKTPDYVSGDSDMVAVRVTTHPLVRKMCQAVGSPIISTSANPASEEPARSSEEVESYFGEKVIIIDGSLGEQQAPSKIIHSQTMEIIRS